jgi:Na+:H+ antiporter
LSRVGADSSWRDSLYAFWPLIDDTLNTLLYILIGFEVLAIDFEWQVFLAVVVAVPLALIARLISVGAPLLVLRVPHTARATSLLTWAGLRGGVSIALALILPESPYRNMLLTMCFGVVIFSMVVQGLLLPQVVAALYGRPQPEPSRGAPQIS